MDEIKAVEAFIGKWQGVTGSERANYQLFVTGLCDVLGVPQPDPASDDTLKADGGQVAKLGRLLLASGARTGEARLAKWADIRRDEGLWVVPAANSKSKKNRSIPLNPSAIEVLNELDTEGKYEYLFVQRRSRSGKGLPLSASINKAWGKLCEKAGITGYTPHSNRHQMASLMVQGGCTLYEVQHVLGHASPTVTQRYAHLSTKSLAAASNTASLAIQRAMGGPAMAAAPAATTAESSAAATGRGERCPSGRQLRS